MVRRSFQYPQRRCSPFWSLQHREERKERRSIASFRKPISIQKVESGNQARGPERFPLSGQVMAEGRWLVSWISSGKPPADSDPKLLSILCVVLGMPDS